MSNISYSACKAHEPYCHLARLARPYFSTYLTTGMIFFGGGILNIKFVHLIFLQRLKQLVLRRIHRHIITNAHRSSCNVPLSLEILKKLDFFPNTQIPNFMKICRVGAKLFHAGGRTDTHDEANSRFLEFCERA
jgi:hypothetical protein